MADTNNWQEFVNQNIDYSSGYRTENSFVFFHPMIRNDVTILKNFYDLHDNIEQFCTMYEEIRRMIPTDNSILPHSIYNEARKQIESTNIGDIEGLFRDFDPEDAFHIRRNAQARNALNRRLIENFNHEDNPCRIKLREHQIVFEQFDPNENNHFQRDLVNAHHAPYNLMRTVERFMYYDSLSDKLGRNSHEDYKVVVVNREGFVEHQQYVQNQIEELPDNILERIQQKIYFVHRQPSVRELLQRLPRTFDTKDLLTNIHEEDARIGLGNLDINLELTPWFYNKRICPADVGSHYRQLKNNC